MSGVIRSSQVGVPAGFACEYVAMLAPYSIQRLDRKTNVRCSNLSTRVKLNGASELIGAHSCRSGTLFPTCVRSLRTTPEKIVHKMFDKRMLPFVLSLK